VGWTFFYLAQIKASAFGFDKERAVRRTVNRFLANLKWDKFNSLEITQVAAKRFLGLAYVIVSAQVRRAYAHDDAQIKYSTVPIHLLFISTGSGEPVVSRPRNLIVVGLTVRQR
jgi:hypothetical protein